ncbi:MAG: hypothetical protein ACI4RA_00275, partial [Kiritimatiellia bacterium]
FQRQGGVEYRDETENCVTRRPVRGGADAASPDFFTGKPQVAGLGRVFLFRNYRADLAKWQTADPLGYPDGWNQLAYCGNSSTTSVDIKRMSIFDNYFDAEQGVFIFNRWLDGMSNWHGEERGLLFLSRV